MYTILQLPHHRSRNNASTAKYNNHGSFLEKKHTAAKYYDKQRPVCWITFIIFVMLSQAVVQL